MTKVLKGYDPPNGNKTDLSQMANTDNLKEWAHVERGLVERKIRQRFEQHGNLARVDNILEAYTESLVRRCAGNLNRLPRYPYHTWDRKGDGSSQVLVGAAAAICGGTMSLFWPSIGSVRTGR